MTHTAPKLRTVGWAAKAEDRAYGSLDTPRSEHIMASHVSTDGDDVYGLGRAEDVDALTDGLLDSEIAGITFQHVLSHREVEVGR
ncbi:unnamed protein product [Clonostachys rosea f. rosea IK726]|uniref:Uncharacterized protein n=1 Tax=Clonostachys rosea f. rosea IK726 TaxID=1349383 RepID=A0ACA9TIY5_BIOOC|nr:unnamed protein product [Clonostachys rosea f. rosea IK726]